MSGIVVAGALQSEVPGAGGEDREEPGAWRMRFNAFHNLGANGIAGSVVDLARCLACAVASVFSFLYSLCLLLFSVVSPQRGIDFVPFQRRPWIGQIGPSGGAGGGSPNGAEGAPPDAASSVAPAREVPAVSVASREALIPEPQPLMEGAPSSIAPTAPVQTASYASVQGRVADLSHIQIMSHTQITLFQTAVREATQKVHQANAQLEDAQELNARLPGEDLDAEMFLQRELAKAQSALAIAQISLTAAQGAGRVVDLLVAQESAQEACTSAAHILEIRTREAQEADQTDQAAAQSALAAAQANLANLQAAAQTADQEAARAVALAPAQIVEQAAARVTALIGDRSAACTL